MADPTLEQLFDTITKLGSKVDTFMATHDDKDHKNMEAKKAEDEKKEEEKMEAKKAKYSASMKIAMEEENHEKKMAMVKAAEEEYNDNKKHEAFGKPDDEKTAQDKEDKEHIAAIIEADKQIYIDKILTAATVTNPANVKAIEQIVKSASITKLKEMAMMTPSFEGSVQTTISQQEKIIPFFANITPADVDANQLTASSPDSDFTKLSTKELLEGDQ